MVPCPSLTVRTGFYYCSEISAHADCKALTYQLPLLADTHWKLTILTPPPAPTPPPYSRPCPHSTLRLPLHLSANNLLEPTMPFTHLCLPPQIELFDARRRHATTHTQTHTHILYPLIILQYVCYLCPQKAVPFLRSTAEKRYFIVADMNFLLTNTLASWAVTTWAQLACLRAQSYCAITLPSPCFCPHEAHMPQGVWPSFSSLVIK